ncbi:MAG: two-component regulator propeller domain-containing protein [Flavobacteriales bacterium]
MKKVLFSAFWLLAFNFCLAQPVAIGKWRDHLPYNHGVAAVAAGDRIYCGTTSGFFYYDTKDNSVNKLSKPEGLADVGVNAIAYSSSYNTAILGYSNGNIDLIVGELVINFSQILNSTVVGDKSINAILISGDLAYLSCGFGIVVFDLAKREIKDTYKIGFNSANVFVNEIKIYNGKIYAATKNGIYVANASSNFLNDFQQWTMLSDLPLGSYNTVEVVNNKLYTNFDNGNSNQDTLYAFDNNTWTKFIPSTYVNDDVVDLNAGSNGLLVSLKSKAWVLNSDYSMKYEYSNLAFNIVYWWELRPSEAIEVNGKYYFADERYGLVQFEDTKGTYLMPNGPRDITTWEMKAKNGNVWVVTGGYKSDYSDVYNILGIYKYDGSMWSNFFPDITPGLDSVYDIVTLAPDPSFPNKVFLGSYIRGAAEFNNNQIAAVYNQYNSPFQSMGGGRVLNTGLDFDANGNLWAVCSGFPGFPVSTPLLVYKSGSGWQGFNISPLSAVPSVLSKLMVDSRGNKWIIRTKQNFGISVVKEQDDNLNSSTKFYSRELNKLADNGGLPSERVNEIAEDKKGQIWVATDQGVAVFYNLDNLYSGAINAEQVLIEEDGVWHHLLETNRVTAIAIDGGNKKWFGTDGNGVYQMSEDGKTQLQHFTKENSALVSNNIIDITIDETSGEVFFASDKGIVSYRGTATEGGLSNGDVYAYPNPVKPDFTGTIGIINVVDNAIVKITDVKGNMVYETRAEGGQATWNGKLASGERAATGVYLVFVSNSDGTEKAVTKILFIN